MPNPLGHVSAAQSELDYDMSSCPALHKCILLTPMGIAVIGQIDSETRSSYVAWAALPKRNKAREKELGILR